VAAATTAILTVYFRPMPVRRLSRFAVVTSALFAAFALGCSNQPSAQARNQDEAAKPRAIETDRV